MRRHRPSALRTAPWVRAPILFLRQPSVSLAVGVTALILGLTAAGAPIYLASVGSAAVSLQVGQNCAPSLGDVASGGGPVAGLHQADTALTSLSAQSLRRAQAPPDALRPPIITLKTDVDVRRGTGSSNLAQLATRTNGLAHVDEISGGPGPGVWVSNDLAASMHLHPGSHLSLSIQDTGVSSLDGRRPVRVRVAGTYRQLVGTTLPPFWCSSTGIFGTPDANFPPPPVILASQSTFLSILHATGAAAVNYFIWEKPPSTGLDLPAATRTATAVSHFTKKIGLGSTGRAPMPLTHIAGGFVVSDFVTSQYGFIAAHAVAVQQAVRQSIVPVALASGVIAALLVAAAGSYWADRRKVEIALLSSRGVSPVALGLKASLEMLVPVALGSALGWAAALGLIATIGPSASFGSAAVMDAVWLALIGTAVGLVLLGLVAGLRASGRARRPEGSRRSRWSRVPVELVGLGLSLWLWLRLGQSSLEAGGTSAQAVPTGFLLFPLVFLVSCIALATRLLVAGLRRPELRRSTAHGRVSLWLTVRRLASTPQAAGVLVATVAAALGVFVYTAGLTRSQEATLHAKAETFVGADVSANVDALGPLPPTLSGQATEVLADSNGDTVGSTLVDLLGVEPSTFADGAFWDSSYSSQSLSGLMGDLEMASHQRGAVPVIVAGGQDLRLRAGLSFTGYAASSGTVPVRLVATTADFPGENGSTPLVIMTRADLNRLDPDAQSQVWSHGSQSQVLSELGRSRIAVPIVEASSDVLNLTEFASIGWTFAYLQSLGFLIGAVAVGSLLLFLTARGRARALSYVLARKMGLSRRAHAASLALELGVLFAAGAVLGTALAWLAVEMVDSHLNPLPDIPPPPLVEVPWAGLAAGGGFVVVAWLLTTAWAQHVVERSRPAELVRFDD